MKISLTLLVALTLGFAQAQGKQSQKVSYDFDGDKKTDVFQIKNGVLAYALSSVGNKEVRSKGGSPADNTWLELSKNVVVYHCQFMRGTNTFKFRYDPKIKQFKLIGYDNEQFGNALNDGSGRSSYNLLTGDYQANWFYYDEKKQDLMPKPAIKKKWPVKTYLLKDFGEETIDQLYEVELESDKG